MSDKEQLYERINDSQIDEEATAKKKKQCMCWTLILLLVAAFAAVVILVLVFKKSGNMESENFYTMEWKVDELWRFQAHLKDTRSKWKTDDKISLFKENLDASSSSLGKDAPEIKPNDITKLISNIAFSIAMTNENTFHATYHDKDDSNKWDAKDSGLFEDVRENYGMRLSNYGFKASDDYGFGWSIYDMDDAS